MQWLWIASLTVPVAVALLVSADEPTRRLGRALVPYAPLPMLVMAIFAPAGELVEVSWWMLGSVLGVDAAGQVFLLLTAALWTIAACYGRAYLRDDPRQDRFWVFFLLAMLGNLGLTVSFDIAGFYLFFALMTFASFALVVHDESVFAHFAGKVYIVMAVVGEALLLMGIFGLAAALDVWTLRDVAPVLAHPWAGAIIVLLLAGFGVKAGALGLHMWLPLAHPAAPTPASAVLSGAMIKAGLLGWMRFVPGGDAALPVIGPAVLVLGLAAAFYGVVIGVMQTHPKSNLAYSSVSQMGFMTVGLGVALIEPTLWPTALLIVSLYALHHGLAKAALFLSVGVAQYASWARWQVIGLYAGIAVAALSLAGLPLSSGYLAKSLLKDLGPELPGAWYAWMRWTLPLAAVGTTLLMGRFVWLIHQARLESHDRKQGLWLAWGVSVAGVVLVTWVAPTWYALEVSPPAVGWGVMWASFWPVALGLGMAMVAAWRGWLMNARRPAVPPGDVLLPVLRVNRYLVRSWTGLVIPVSMHLSDRLFRWRNRMLLKTGRWMNLGELVVIRWGTGGLMFLTLILVIVLVVVAF